jgi:tetratricopeptide (TPR) repeat protein
LKTSIYKQIFFFLILSVLPSFAFSQKVNIDSLITEIGLYKNEDTTKINMLLEVTKHLGMKRDEEALLYGNQALKLSERIQSEKLIGQSYYNIGIYYDFSNQFDKALDYYNSSLEIRKKLNDDQGVASVFYQISYVYFLKSDYQSAIDYLMKSVVLREKIGDKDGLGKSYNLMASSYKLIADYSNALNYYFKAQKIQEELGNKLQVGNLYSNIANVYSDQNMHKEALENHLKALDIRIKENDEKKIAESYNNIGLTYELLEDYDKALEFLSKSRKLKENLKESSVYRTMINIANVYKKLKKWRDSEKLMLEAIVLAKENKDDRAISNYYTNLGELYNLQKEHDKAIKYFNQSLQISEESNIKSLMKSAYEGLADAYSALGNFEEAYSYHKKYFAVNESIFNEKNAQIVNEMSARFETEKKEKEIELLNQETKLLNQQNELQNEQLRSGRIIIVSTIVGLLLLLVLVFVILKGLREKNKANELLESQNLEIIKQTGVIERKNKDIMDSIVYAKRIQYAILPPDEMVKATLPESFILFKPKDIVSGDFYWYFDKEIDGQKIVLFSAVDCTGHGVPGAFMSIVGYNALNKAVSEEMLIKPGEILNNLNYNVSKTLRQDVKNTGVRDGMDMSLSAINLNTLELNYAGANNPLWIIRDGLKEEDFESIVGAKIQDEILLEIKADKQAIGYTGLEIQSFTNHKIQLKKGDLIYMFSDGYQDQFGGEKGKKFKSNQLRSLLISIKEEPMQVQKQILDKTMLDWMGSEHEQIDDILVIGVRI